MGIEAVGVVVPAHNEAATIRRCVNSILAAAKEVTVPVLVALVDDGSSDGTGEIARNALSGSEHTVASVRFRNVGAARKAGHARVIEYFRGIGTSRLWIAGTDADSIVGRDWLARQLDLASEGVDAVAGTIRLANARPGLRAAFEAEYRAKVWGTAHGHIHGANMGTRASAYLEAGGFHAQPCHEDVSLWRRLRATAGVVCRAESGLVVATSGRRTGRLTGGFASYLAALEVEREGRGVPLAG